MTTSSNEYTAWRIIDAGLCLEGRCLAPRGMCIAYQQMVIGNIGFGKFTISRMHTFPCPLCEYSVRAERYGLNRCQWRILNTRQWFYVGEHYETYNLSRFPIHLDIRISDKSLETIDDCTVCLSPMDKRKQCSILRCKHMFHVDCIQKWIDTDKKTSLECPICRTGIFE